MGIGSSRGGGSDDGSKQSGSSDDSMSRWWTRKAGSSSRVPDDAHIQRMIRDGTLAPMEGVTAGQCSFSAASIECPICFLVSA
jgi:hypothetical protein